MATSVEVKTKRKAISGEPLKAINIEQVEQGIRPVIFNGHLA